MRPVLWTPRALDDLEQIAAYIAERNLDGAMRLTDRIVDAVDERLPGSPAMGRPGRIDGTRELVVHRNYVVVYEIAPDRISILTVRHVARSWPEQL